MLHFGKFAYKITKDKVSYSTKFAYKITKNKESYRTKSVHYEKKLVFRMSEQTFSFIFMGDS